MKIKKAEIVEKVWGYEEYIANFPDSGYCGKKLHLNKGYRCSVHSHPEKDETFYIEKGRIYFSTIGGVDPWMLIGQRISVETTRGMVYGIITTDEMSNGLSIKENPKLMELFIFQQV